PSESCLLLRRRFAVVTGPRARRPPGNARGKGALGGHALQVRNDQLRVVALRHADLVGEHDLLPLLGRRHNGERYLERGHTPASVVERLLTLVDGLLELDELSLAPCLTGLVVDRE